ncbi:MAG: hypothetical protein HY360_17925 [Verrucomicrobia bacterium]|nr:hypothetical protein [Verrucomicrobiota bacterium]
MDPDLLKAKMTCFERLARKTLDGRGICLLTIDGETEEPVTDSFFRGMDRIQAMAGHEFMAAQPDVKPAEYWSYENPGMSAHRYLSALAHKKQAGYPAEAAVEARRVFEGLLEAHRLGGQIEHGLICKPYGLRPSMETSIDELFGHSMALWIYHHHFATETERQAIAAQCVKTAEWVLRHNFQYVYFGKPKHLYRWDRPLAHRTPMLKVPMFFHLAGQLAGESALAHLGAAMTLRGRDILDWRDPTDGHWRTEFGCERHNLYQWQSAAAVCSEFALFLKNHFDWRRFIVESYEATQALYLKNENAAPASRLVGLNVGMEAEKHAANTIAYEEAARHLAGIEKIMMSLKDGMEPGADDKKHAFLDRLLSAHSLYHWLEAYWRGACFGWW